MSEEQKLGIYRKLIRVAKAVSYLKKDKRNNAIGRGYSYISEEAVKKAVTAALVENELAYGGCDFEVVGDWESETKAGAKTRGVTIRAHVTIVDPDGGQATFVGIGSGLDSGDKHHAKAQTQAIKYALLTAFGISTGDSDPEADESTDHETGPEDRFGAGETRLANPAPQADPGRPATPGEWTPNFGRKKGTPLIDFTRKEGFNLRKWLVEKLTGDVGSMRAHFEMGILAIDAFFSDVGPDNPGAPSKEELRGNEGAPDPFDIDEMPF